jgi:hypothetical protein
MSHAIGCVVNFYNAGVVTRDRRIGSMFEVQFIFEFQFLLHVVISVVRGWTQFKSDQYRTPFVHGNDSAM